MFRSWLSAIWFALVIVTSVWGQNAAAGGNVVHGQVSAGDSALSGLKVQLAHIRDGEAWDADVWWNGAFEFLGVSLGEHRLRVVDSKGNVLHDEMVWVGRDGETLSIHLRPEDVGPNGRAETISVQQLSHKSPRKALNELKNGRAAMEKQQFARAVGHLQSAVAVDPESADAHNDLGVAYYQLQQYPQSAEHFRRAVGLAPTHARANSNLCLVLLKTGRYGEAGQAASSAHERGTSSAVTHYAAAIALLSSGGDVNDALDHLRRSQREMPKVRLVTARVLAESGRRVEAARELEAYLRSPEGDADARRPELEAWLPELKR